LTAKKVQVSPGVWQLSGTIAAPATAVGARFIELQNIFAAGGTYADVKFFQIEAKPWATPFAGYATTRTASAVYVPALGLVTPAQGWIAMRVRMGLPKAGAASYTSQDRRFFDLPLTIGLIAGYLPDAGSEYRISMYIDTGAGPSGIEPANLAWEVGDVLTMIFAWTATTLKVSRDGVAFVSGGRSHGAGSLAGQSLIFGTTSGGAAQWFDGEVLWAAAGTGTLTDADAALIHSFGNADKVPTDFPGNCRAVFPMNTAGYLTV
jgi:hypothetical protein